MARVDNNATNRQTKIRVAAFNKTAAELNEESRELYSAGPSTYITWGAYSEAKATTEVQVVVALPGVGNPNPKPLLALPPLIAIPPSIARMTREQAYEVLMHLILKG